MMHDEIVTYEVAKLAKEKGFNVPTDRYYHINDDVIEAQNSLEMTGDSCADFYNSLNQCRCAAPTQSLLQRWLREEKDIHISIIANREEDDDFVWYSNEVLKDTGWSVCSQWERPMAVCYLTYEQALEHALKFALENLV